MNRYIRRLGDTSARHPWRTLGAWAVVAAVVVALTAAFGGKLVDDFSAPGSESARAMDLLEERFPAAAGGGAQAVFAAPAGQQLDGTDERGEGLRAQLGGRDVERDLGESDATVLGDL